MIAYTFYRNKFFYRKGKPVERQGRPDVPNERGEYRKSGPRPNVSERRGKATGLNPAPFWCEGNDSQAAEGTQKGVGHDRRVAENKRLGFFLAEGQGTGLSDKAGCQLRRKNCLLNAQIQG